MSADRLDLDASTLATIEEHGIQVMGIFSSKDDEPTSSFNYTIGLTALDQPEVLVCGLSLRVGQAVCNEVYRRVTEEGVVLVPGLVIPGVLGGDSEYDVTLRPVTDEAEVYRIGGFFLEWSCLQAVFTDFDNRYPWDQGYALDPRVQKGWFIAP